MPRKVGGGRGGPAARRLRIVTIFPKTLVLLRGGSTQLVAGAVDANGNTVAKAATFSSSDTSVAVVADIDQGALLTGVGEGSATITATVDGKQGTASVTVQVLNFVSITAGALFTCALTDVGEAYCWGVNDSGQLGRIKTSGCFDPGGEFGCATEPVRVSEGLAFQSITAGTGHTCALTSTGQAYCWGRNGWGQLGDSTTTDSFQPVPVSGGLQFETLSAGGNYTCGVTSSGQAHCWGGSFFNSALGDVDRTTERSYPGPVSGGLQFEMVSAGRTACGVVVGGSAYCWGAGDRGEIGDGVSTYRQTPVAVSGNLVFQSVSTALTLTCAMTVSGDGYCWGKNDIGQVGDGTIGENQKTPVLVAGGLSFQSVVTGFGFACGLAVGGVGYCWGNNGDGQLGDGSTVDRATPVPISGGLTFATLAIESHSCGITTAGSTYCWGPNTWGWLGNGSKTGSLTPVRVIGSP